MKKITVQLFTCLVSLLMIQYSFAQDDAGKLTIPSTPAFSILNYEPASVMKPTSNKDLASDVLSSFDKDGKLLMNLGLEVSPYWLQSRPYLQRNDYLNPKMGQTFLQSLSISGATVKDSASGKNKFGIGLRFKILNGRPVDSLKDAEDALKAEETIISAIGGARSMVGRTITTRQQAIDFIAQTMKAMDCKQAIIDAFYTDAGNIMTKYSDSEESIKMFLEKLISNRVDINQESLKKVVELSYQRKGLIIEFAGASAFVEDQRNDLDRMGFWINASNYVSPKDLFTLTGRYMFQNKDTAFTNVDVGLSYLKENTSYNISCEGMLRWYRANIPDINQSSQAIQRVEKKFTYRLALQGSYNLSPSISVNISLGKDFDSPFVSGSGFFSILGLNYSIFNKERVQLK